MRQKYGMRAWRLHESAPPPKLILEEIPKPTKKPFFIVEPSREQLTEVAVLLDAGEIQTAVDAEVPFAQANDAFEKNEIRRAGRGKVVIVMN